VDRVHRLPSWRVNLPGGRLRFENGWPPRGGGAQDLRSPLATPQLVDGACLIRRYRAVRFRGGQPWRDSSVGSERRAHNAEVVSSMLTLATAGGGQAGDGSRLLSGRVRVRLSGDARRVGLTVISPGPQPGDCRFKSGTRHPWPHRLLARIRPFQGREGGSEPPGATAQWCNGNMPASLAGRCEFESRCATNLAWPNGRAADC
jgi:hypothetical protein